MLTLTAPAALDGGQLAEEIGTALGREVQIVLHPDGLEVHGAADSDRAKVQQALDAHTPTQQPDPDADFRTALEGATTVAQLRDALLGKAGPGAQARRPSGT